MLLSMLRGELSAAAAGRRAGVSEQTVTTGRSCSWAPGVRVWLRAARQALLEPVGRGPRRLSHRCWTLEA